MPRLAGKQGSVYLGAHKIADIYNITFEIEQELADAGVKLEIHEVYAAGRVTSRLSGERYITDTLTSISGNPEVGGSVWGCSDSQQGYLRQWRATSNGLEGVAALHCDSLLVLDEISEVNPREAGLIAYMLANGQGKARAGRLGP